MTAPSLTTREGAEAFALEMLGGARRNFETDGFLVPVAALLVQRNPKTREALPAGEAAPILVALEGDVNAQTKARFTRVVASAVRDLAACGVLLVLETWTVRADRTKRPPTGPLSEHPDRYETLLASFEHAVWDGPRVWEARILREGAAAPRLTPWRELRGVSLGGQFAGLLAKPRRN